MTNLRIRTLEPIVISSDEDSPIKVKPVKRHRLEKQPNRSPVQFQTMEPVNEAERRVDTVERQQMDTVERQRMDRQRTNAFERLRNEELLGLPSATVQIPHQGTQWQMDEVFSKRLESPVQRKIKISEESDPDPQSDELDTESQSNVVHETQEKNPFLESLQTSSPKSAQTDSQNEKTPNTGNKLSNNDFLRNFLKSGFRTGFQDVDQEMIHSKPSRLESLLRGMEERSETLSRSVDPLPSIQDAQPVTATQYVQRQAERQLTRKLMERQEKREMTERRMVKEAINAPVEIIAVENVEPTLEPVEDEVLVIGDTFAILGMLSATVYNPDIETLSRGGGDSFAGWLRCGYKIGENKLFYVTLHDRLVGNFDPNLSYVYERMVAHYNARIDIWTLLDRSRGCWAKIVIKCPHDLQDQLAHFLLGYHQYLMLPDVPFTGRYHNPQHRMLSHYQTIAPKPFEQPPLPPAPNFQSWEQYQQQVQTRHQLPQPLPNGDQFVRPTKFNYTREDRQVETAKRQVERLYETFSSIDLPEAIQDDLLQTDLHKHQRQGLYFLLQREEVPKYESGIWIKEHDQYKNQITDTYASDEPYPVLGGILCDEMGVGKTLQMIALILSTLPSQPLTQPKRVEPKPRKKFDFGFVPPEQAPDKKDDIPGRGIYPSKSTLIVCPLSTVSNWEEQVQTHTKNRALSVYVFHGQSRSDDPEYIAKHDVVITTYSTLALQIKKERVGPLLEIYWFRVILDEAHIIKTVSTAQSKACHLLTASRRWCLTGTPIQNKIDDLYSLIKFLQIEPLNVKANWQRYITKNMKSADSLGMKRLQALMKIIALRRTKDQKIDGQPIIHLPSKRETIRMIELASAERVKYDHIHETAKQFFKSLMKKGQVMQNYVHILEAILRMRQACNHPSLVKDDWFESLQETENTLEHARRTYQLLKETGEDICQCGAPVDDMIFVSDCSHLCCADCRAKKQCITCGKKDHFVQVMDQDLEPLLNGSCTKIEELVRDLKEVKQQDPSIKSIVFSQWTSMLQLIKDQLSHHGFKSVALTGQMTRQQRYEAMETFKSDDRYTVFLVSLQSGGVGLNLVRASRVYIIEPYWNPAVESQAIDRVHRLGQTRPVEAIRFIIKRSIEENMLALQQYKMELAQDAFREKKRKQVQVERLESLRMLFD